MQREHLNELAEGDGVIGIASKDLGNDTIPSFDEFHAESVADHI